MKAHLKCTLAMLSLLATPMFGIAAQPVVLDAANMDRVTAGSRPLFERIAGVLDSLPRGVGDIGAPTFEGLSAEQMALLTQALQGEQIAFEQTRPGELTATHKLPSGETLVIVKQLSSGEAASPATELPGVPAVPSVPQQVTTHLFNPGEPLNVRQASSNGVNYLYLRSTGNSPVSIIQRSGF